MGNRFGRNKRRKARAALAEAMSLAQSAEHRAKYLEGQLSEQNKKLMALNSVIDGVRDAIGEHSVIFDPIVRKINLNDNSNRLIVEFDAEPLNYWDKSVTPMLHSYYRTYAADVIQAHVEKDHWTRKVHFLAQRNGVSEVAYCVDERLLCNNDAACFIKQNVAQYLAEAFINGLEKERVIMEAFELAANNGAVKFC
jgi:uncharacterized coiled-coil protein SlyX